MIYRAGVIVSFDVYVSEYIPILKRAVQENEGEPPVEGTGQYYYHYLTRGYFSMSFFRDIMSWISTKLHLEREMSLIMSSFTLIFPLRT